MTAKDGGRNKAITVVGIILAAVIAVMAVFTVISHAAYHRSDMATAVEIYFRLSGTRHKFSDIEERHVF